METVDAMVAALAERGHSIWIDRAGIVGSQTWRAKIVEALKMCQAVIFFGSRASYASRHVATELTLAEEARKPIVPVLLDDSRPDGDMLYFLARLHQIKLRGSDAGRVVGDIDCALLNIGEPDCQRTVGTLAPARRKSGVLQALAALAVIVTAGVTVRHYMVNDAGEFHATTDPPLRKHSGDGENAGTKGAGSGQQPGKKQPEESGMAITRTPPVDVLPPQRITPPPPPSPTPGWLARGKTVEVAAPIRGGVLTKQSGTPLTQRIEFEKGKRLTVLDVAEDRIQLWRGLAEGAWLDISKAPQFLKPVP